MGNGVGQGGVGLWDLHVPTLGGHIPTPRTQQSGKTQSLHQ